MFIPTLNKKSPPLILYTVHSLPLSLIFQDLTSKSELIIVMLDKNETGVTIGVGFYRTKILAHVLALDLVAWIQLLPNATLIHCITTFHWYLMILWRSEITMDFSVKVRRAVERWFVVNRKRLLNRSFRGWQKEVFFLRAFSLFFFFFTGSVFYLNQVNRNHSIFSNVYNTS